MNVQAITAELAEFAEKTIFCALPVASAVNVS
jgi:hypothetical protein